MTDQTPEPMRALVEQVARALCRRGCERIGNEECDEHGCRFWDDEVCGYLTDARVAARATLKRIRERPDLGKELGDAMERATWLDRIDRLIEELGDD